jgi:hypothetical protein
MGVCENCYLWVRSVNIWLMRAQLCKHLMASPNAILQLLFSIYCNSELKTDFSSMLAQLAINLMRKCVKTDFKAHIIFLG